VFDWLDENGAELAPLFVALAALLLVVTLVFLVLWLRARRFRRRLAAANADRSDLELALAEQTARLRIVRELHEVAVHSVSVIISQAEGARYAGEQDPGAAVRSAGVIADAARATLADLRRVMTVVGEGDVDASQPAPVESVASIVGAARKAGLDVKFSETGERFDLQPGADLAVNSILKTALANSLAHGGGGTEAVVALVWTDGGLGLTVDDDGIRAQARRAGLDPNALAQQRAYSIDDDLNALTGPITGAGITEMRERSALFGGVFTANAVPGVGFSVSVVFPALRYHNGVHGVNFDA